MPLSGIKSKFINVKGTKLNSVKTKARHLLDELPDDATWDDLMYRIYVRQSVESGLKDVKAGRVHSLKAVRAKFSL